jgi:hypothetical protein
METSSLRKNWPHLEAVLGPLSAQDDASVRAILDEVDGVLLEIARHFDQDGAGWEGTGLELTWAPSGQVAISSHVGACTEGRKCVDFCIELRPSWYFGERSSTLRWEIATEIYADCHHAVDHGSMGDRAQGVRSRGHRVGSRRCDAHGSSRVASPRYGSSLGALAKAGGRA